MLSSLSLKSYHHIIVFNFVKNPFWQNPNGFTETSNGIDINSCSAPIILIPPGTGCPHTDPAKLERNRDCDPCYWPGTLVIGISAMLCRVF